MALGPRHPADTMAYEDWVERCADYRTRELWEMLKYAEGKRDAALKAKRFRKVA